MAKGKFVVKNLQVCQPFIFCIYTYDSECVNKFPEIEHKKDGELEVESIVC